MLFVVAVFVACLEAQYPFLLFYCVICESLELLQTFLALHCPTKNTNRLLWQLCRHSRQLNRAFQAGSSAYGQRGGKGARGTADRPLSPVMDDDAFVGFLNEAARRIL